MNENIDDNIPEKMDLFWIEILENQSRNSIRSMEEGAKGLLTACSLLATVYIFVISSFLKDTIYSNFRWLILFCSPILFFILSIFASIMVLYPHKYDANLYSPKQCKKTIEKIGRRNSKWMRWSLILLICGGFNIIIVIYLSLLNS